MKRLAPSLGFTLLELVLVMVLVGILAALTVDIFLKPFRAFQDQARRAELVAEADAAISRMVRELRHAVPNSVRVGGGGQYLEFIPTVDSGRYRAAQDPTTPGVEDILDFDQTDSSFEVIGGLHTGNAQAGDYVVIYNTCADCPVTNAYLGNNRAPIQSISTNILTFSPTQFPHPSLDAQRFEIVPASGPVSFYCHSGQLRRHTDYGFQTSQPTGWTTEGALLAQHVSTCQFDYDPGDNVRNGIVTIRLGLSDGGETITLLNQAHVVNAP